MRFGVTVAVRPMRSRRWHLRVSCYKPDSCQLQCGSLSKMGCVVAPKPTFSEIQSCCSSTLMMLKSVAKLRRETRSSIQHSSALRKAHSLVCIRAVQRVTRTLHLTTLCLSVRAQLLFPSCLVPPGFVCKVPCVPPSTNFLEDLDHSLHIPGLHTIKQYVRHSVRRYVWLPINSELSMDLYYVYFLSWLPYTCYYKKKCYYRKKAQVNRL